MFNNPLNWPYTNFVWISQSVFSVVWYCSASRVSFDNVVFTCCCLLFFTLSFLFLSLSLPMCYHCESQLSMLAFLYHFVPHFLYPCINGCAVYGLAADSYWYAPLYFVQWTHMCWIQKLQQHSFLIPHFVSQARCVHWLDGCGVSERTRYEMIVTICVKWEMRQSEKIDTFPSVSFICMQMVKGAERGYICHI